MNEKDKIKKKIKLSDLTKVCLCVYCLWCRQTCEIFWPLSKLLTQQIHVIIMMIIVVLLLFCLTELYIEMNPFECKCDQAKWIRKLVNKRNNILGPYWADVTCQADKSYNLVPGRKYALANLTFYDCGKLF